MVALQRFNSGESPVQSAKLNLIVDALTGAANTPVNHGGVNDAVNYALQIRNQDPAGKAVIIYAPDGTTVLFQVTATGVLASSSGAAAAQIVTTTGTQTLSGKTLSGLVATGAVDFTGAATVKGVPQQNQLVNPGFEIWQRGTSFTTNGATTADRWILNLAGTDAATITKETTSVDVGSAAALKAVVTVGTGAGASGAYQNLQATEYTGLAGKTVTFSARVKTSTASAIRIGLNNYFSSTNHFTYSSYHTGDGTWQTLTVTAAMDATLTTCQPYVLFAASTTAYLDNATLVGGSVPMDYLPLAPADEWARCLRHYQRITGNELGAFGHMTAATTATLGMRFLQQMGGQPTVTFSAATDFAVRNGAGSTVLTVISAANISAIACTILATTAGGLTVGQGTELAGATANDVITLEWNP